jgi:enamine deaminase RidA (YjgF/YER057c/UK114 family)
MMQSPAFSQVVAVEGNTRTVYVGGQDAVDAEGNLVGEGDIGAQTAQALANVERALAAAGAGLEHLIKVTVYVVAGQPVEPGFHAWMRTWANRGTPPTVSVVFVAALGHPAWLVEIEAVAVVALSETGEPLPA